MKSYGKIPGYQPTAFASSPSASAIHSCSHPPPPLALVSDGLNRGIYGDFRGSNEMKNGIYHQLNKTLRWNFMGFSGYLGS